MTFDGFVTPDVVDALIEADGADLVPIDHYKTTTPPLDNDFYYLLSHDRSHGNSCYLRHAKTGNWCQVSSRGEIRNATKSQTQWIEEEFQRIMSHIDDK
jgi:hypothetical protein